MSFNFCNYLTIKGKDSPMHIQISKTRENKCGGKMEVAFFLYSTQLQDKDDWSTNVIRTIFIQNRSSMDSCYSSLYLLMTWSHLIVSTVHDCPFRYPLTRQGFLNYNKRWFHAIYNFFFLSNILTYLPAFVTNTVITSDAEL